MKGAPLTLQQIEALKSKIAELEKKDYIVESRENYRKWSDGTLECWGTKKLYNIAIDVESRGEYVNGNGLLSFGDYPVPFKSGTIPSCVFQMEQNYTTNVTIKFRTYGAGSTTTPPAFVIVAPSAIGASPVAGYIFHYQAIGRWK